MRTAQAVTGAGGIPVGYATLALVYARSSLSRVAWVLRRLARAPLELPSRAPRCEALSDASHELPLLVRARRAGALRGARAAPTSAPASGSCRPVAARARRASASHAHHAMAPVWEANHVWLIFVLTVVWTAYPSAFGSIASTLAIPLFIAAIGHHPPRRRLRAARRRRDRARAAPIDIVFALSSILTPFALGAAIGGIASGRVPVGNAAGDLSRAGSTRPRSLIGVLAVATSAYLAAVYPRRRRRARSATRELERRFARAALGAGVVAGASRSAGLVVAARRRATALPRAR